MLWNHLRITMLAKRWFENNYMKLNTDKCHLIVSGYKYEQVWTNIGKDLIWESDDVKLLRITTDSDPKFDKHVLKLCSQDYMINIINKQN